MCPFESKINLSLRSQGSVLYVFVCQLVKQYLFRSLWRIPFIRWVFLKANASSTCPLTRLMNSFIHSSAPRWRWSLLLLIGSLLMCLLIIGAYFIQGVLKGLWSIIWSLNGDKTYLKKTNKKNNLIGELCFSHRLCVEMVERRWC